MIKSKSYLSMAMISIALMLVGCSKKSIPYCDGTVVTPVESQSIQATVTTFAKSVGCRIGDHCLLKWGEQGNKEKFSIAWKEACGPIVNGVPQLGDQGRGSTFVCQKQEGQICCWPMGFDYMKQFVVCKDTADLPT